MPELDLTIEPPADPEVTDAAGTNGAAWDRPATDDPADAGLVDLEAGPPEVSELTVRVFLGTASASLAGITRDHPANNDGGPPLWMLSERELDALAPLLTQMANERPAVARLIERGNVAAVFLILANYTGHNLGRMRAAANADDLEQDTPDLVGG